MSTQPSFRDVEQLSAYLDGRLSRADSARLESRIKSEPALRAVMEELSQTRALLRKLPSRRAPRNFTLTPKMAGVKPPLPRAYPALRFATGLATLLFVLSFAVNAFSFFAVGAPAPMMVYGRGGGAPASSAVATAAPATQAPAAQAPAPAATQPPLATMAPALQAPLMATNVAPTEAFSADNAQRAQATATAEASPKNFVPEQLPSESPVQPPSTSAPVSRAWQVGLFVLAVFCGGSAWLVRIVTDRSWRAKMK